MSNIIIFDSPDTGLHPLLKIRRSADSLILNAVGTFETNPLSYPVMIEDTVIAGKYGYPIPALSDGEYTYVIYDPGKSKNIGDGMFYVYLGDIVTFNVPVTAIIESIRAMGGTLTYPFIAVLNPVSFDGQVVDYIRGDTKPMYFYLPDGWDVTNKYVFLCAKKNRSYLDSQAIINRTCTIIDGQSVMITPTTIESGNPGTFYAELRQYDDNLGTVNPQTIMEFSIDFNERIRT